MEQIHTVITRRVNVFVALYFTQLALSGLEGHLGSIEGTHLSFRRLKNLTRV